MSIDYKVTVSIPVDVQRVYGSDDVFRLKIDEVLSKCLFGDLANGNIIAEFESLEDAEKAEADLHNLMSDYESQYDWAVTEVKKAFHAIDELVACHTTSRLKNVLSGIQTSQSFVTYLIDQSIAFSRLSEKADGSFEMIDE